MSCLSTQVWSCCRCGLGPLIFEMYTICIDCNHRRCNICKLETVPGRKPKPHEPESRLLEQSASQTVKHFENDTRMPFAGNVAQQSSSNTYKQTTNVVGTRSASNVSNGPYPPSPYSSRTQNEVEGGLVGPQLNVDGDGLRPVTSIARYIDNPPRTGIITGEFGRSKALCYDLIFGLLGIVLFGKSCISFSYTRVSNDQEKTSESDIWSEISSGFDEASIEDSLNDLATSALKFLMDHNLVEFKSNLYIIATPFCVHEDFEQSWGDKLMCSMEDISEERWDWFPLQAPRRPLEKNNSYVHWTTFCGEEIWEQIPTLIALRLKTFHQQCSRSSRTNPSSSTPPGSTKSSSQASGSGSGGLQSKGNGLFSNLRTIYPRKGKEKGKGILQRPQTSQTLQGPAIRMPGTKLVFLAVSKGQYHELAQLEVQGLEDDCFFRNLRKAYIEIRGSFRSIFRIRYYAYCRFVKIEKSSDNEIEPREESLPSPQDQNYEYTVVDEMPPITPRQFNRRFYGCYRGGQHHREIWYCSRPCRPTAKLLARVPKCRHQVDRTTEESEIFWGLEAVEAIRAWKFFLFQALILTLPWVFFGFWITIMGHPADLQNAVVPLTIVLAMWAFLRHEVFKR